MSAWVCGEALMDLLPDQVVVGGGPANTARALAMLGRRVEFIDGISTDHFGKEISEALQEDGVGMKYCNVSEMPTSTARVNVDKEGVASYLFTVDCTATFDFAGEWLPDPSRIKPNLLHIGSLATIVKPGSLALFEWAMHVAEFAPVVFDPNVRTTFLSDRTRYVESVEKWISISSVVKASDSDISWLYPDVDIVTAAKRWIESGVALVVITRGPLGLTGVTADEIIEVKAVLVDVVDTVGAGDTVGAVIVDAILEEGIVNLRGEVLQKALNCAALAAAITCSRAGAQPPTKLELKAKKEKRA